MSYFVETWSEIFKNYWMGFVLAIGLVFGVGWAGVEYTKTIGAAQEDARHGVYKHSTAFVDGKNAELSKLYFEWTREDAAGRAGVETAVRGVIADFDLNDIIDDNIKVWAENCKYNRFPTNLNSVK